jgi:transmembrane sensor
MSEVVKLPTLSDVEDEAAAWVWRLDSETVTEVDRQAFETWIRRDVRNRRAFTEFGGVWRQLDELAEAKRPEKIATFAESPAGRRSRRPLLWAAGIAASAILALGTYLSLPGGSSAETVATAVGQQRTVTLPDASVVTLNTNSILETRFAAEARDVYLRKGEAHFVVAHDRSRPFAVHAGNSVVRAVGTEFDVRVRDAAQVEVIVNEGRVEVNAVELSPTAVLASAREHPRSMTRLVGAGERLVSGPEDVVVQVVSVEDLSKTMAWRQGAVVFEGKPLSEAIAELARYTDTRFVVTDPRITALPVGGRFRTDDVDGFLAALEKAFPVVIRHAHDGVVYIEPRS